MSRADLHSTRLTILARCANIFFEFQRLRLRADRFLGGVFREKGRRRIVATACWNFPIYSQTFVYQELTQLVRGGFALRFLYANLNGRDPFPSQFRRLWRARRRLVLDPTVCERSYAYFAQRSPERIEMLVDMLSSASGMSPEAIRQHYHFRQAFAFARMVEAYRPDYLHSYFFYEGTLFALVASCLLDIPRGVSCYADHMLEDYPLKVVSLHLRQCSVTIATSDRIRRELLGIEPLAASEQILVKPNGINVERFPMMQRSDPDGGHRFSLVSVSRIEPKKGLLYLVDAIGRLRDRNIGVELHVIGGVDDSATSREYADEVAARIRDLGLSDIVHLEGRRSEADINGFFRTSHLFVAPFVETEYGDKDGIPTSLLEAMASGLPVVATDAGSILEVIEDGRDGVIVPQRDPAALANAIAALMADSERRSALGAAGARKIRQKFNAATGERVFHDRLRTLLESRRVGAPGHLTGEPNRT